MDENIFLQNNSCLSPELECSYSDTGDEIFKLYFDADPKIKDQSYNIVIKTAQKVKSATAELIGMNMEMPINKVTFNLKNKNFEVKIVPGFCSESKMLWRLKINLVLSDNTKYYTFINYQVGR